MSSPITYSSQCSPSTDDSPRKRRKLATADARGPLADISNLTSAAIPTATLAGFVDEEDSDGDDEHARLSTSANDQNYTPPTSELHHEDGYQDLELVEKVSDTLPPLSGATITPSISSSTLATAKTCSGHSLTIKQRQRSSDVFYGDLVAAKSKQHANRAQKDYYGIDIHRLMAEGNDAMQAAAVRPGDTPVLPSVEPVQDAAQPSNASKRLHLWTEKYRARKFTDLLGDERTHRSVLHWFKSWDKIVFPGASKPKVKLGQPKGEPEEDKQHKKILLLTGPPGLGKTTLAHICARQAGYETKEINASDERSKDVVNGRIRDMVGTENVRSLDSRDNKKVAKPLCIVVDEADGVVGGSSGGGGEGGFIKALIDLIALDQRNSTGSSAATSLRRKKKGDKFRMLRPLVLICNDVYHPSLRPLRQSPVAEVIHIRRPPLNAVIPRMASIFAREGIKADNDGVRTLCEAAWGVTSRKKGGAGTTGGGGTTEGDIRSVLVIGEWVASRLRCSSLDLKAAEPERLTRKWIEKHVVGELGHNGSAARSLGRGGGKECVTRVFAHNAGFPSSAPKASKVTEDRLGSGGATDATKKATYDRLRDMVHTSGEEDRIVQDIFTQWPTQPFQDTTTLTKPCAAADWLHFSGLISHRVHTSQEWDLMAYSAYPVLALHSFFAATSTASAHVAPTLESSESSTIKEDPFATPRPDLTALELTKQHTATLNELHSTLSIPLRRSFPTPESLAPDLLPYTLRLLNPAASPTLIGGQASLRRAPERERVARAANAMSACGVYFEQARVDAASMTDVSEARAAGNAGRVLRMVPPLDEAGSFLTLDDSRAGRAGGDAGRARYALRAVLEQACKTESAKRDAEARTRRRGGGDVVEAAMDADTTSDSKAEDAKTNLNKGVKRDFFGRPIAAVTAAGDAVASLGGDALGAKKARKEVRGRSAVWVTFHEGFSNAVRKPITMRELLEGM